MGTISDCRAKRQAEEVPALRALLFGAGEDRLDRTRKLGQSAVARERDDPASLSATRDSISSGRRPSRRAGELAARRRS
jgi:hypothetical protein